MVRHLEIKWESNSRVKNMVRDGKIKSADVISKTTTGKFPAECVTVRLHRVRDKNPHVGIYVRGKEATRSWNYPPSPMHPNGQVHSWDYTETMIMSFNTKERELSFSGSTKVDDLPNLKKIVDKVSDALEV